MERTIVERRDEGEVRRLAEASAWAVRLSEHDLPTSEDFEAWLAADPANAAAWDRVQASWTQVDEQASSPELLQLRRDALGRAHRRARARRDWPGQRVALAACLALLLLAGIGGGGLWWHLQPTVYETAMGERRVITLADGSTASLDSGTELKVRYSGDSRNLELVSGQARFDVAHAADWPFVVQARDKRIVAVGTAFNIDLLGKETLVTLIEGRVMVTDRSSRSKPLVAFKGGETSAIALSPGQQLLVVPGEAVRRRVDVEKTQAWERGMLVFDNEPLAAVAERISRYTPEPVVVAPGAAGLKISGVFKAGDEATFVDVLTHYLPVRAEREGDRTVIAPKA
jgi:transmembrane sensor